MDTRSKEIEKETFLHFYLHPLLDPHHPPDLDLIGVPIFQPDVRILLIRRSSLRNQQVAILTHCCNKMNKRMKNLGHNTKDYLKSPNPVEKERFICSWQFPLSHSPLIKSIVVYGSVTLPHYLSTFPPIFNFCRKSPFRLTSITGKDNMIPSQDHFNLSKKDWPIQKLKTKLMISYKSLKSSKINVIYF